MAGRLVNMELRGVSLVGEMVGVSEEEGGVENPGMLVQTMAMTGLRGWEG